jgi:hypothetical protein
MTNDSEARMEKLSQILWRERELLDSLLYKLELEQMVLASGRTRWLMRSAREVESVLTTIRETEILRSIAADQVAASIGLSDNPSLRSLSEACDEPWRSILADHHEAFVAAIADVSALADANRDLITASYRSAREALRALDGDADGAAPRVSDKRQRLASWSRT